jgi:uncharacterized membrane protein YfcA
MTIRNALLAILSAAALMVIAVWVADLRRAYAADRAAVRLPTPLQFAIGFVTNFFDTLGIGSFATTTAAFQTFRLVPDERLPGTLIIGHSLPAILQGLLFLAAVQVDPLLALVLIAATVIGSRLGARVSTRLPRRPIQLGMGVGLALAATFMTLSQIGGLPEGGTAIGLPAGRLAIAAATFVGLGALLTIGIGNFAPSLLLLSLMGMDPRAAFPVMMGASALSTFAAGSTFMREGRYERRAALGLTLGGLPAVLIAGLLVKSLPLTALRWLVVVVVLYAAVRMLSAAFGTRPDTPTLTPGP